MRQIISEISNVNFQSVNRMLTFCYNHRKMSAISRSLLWAIADATKDSKIASVDQ